MSLAVPPPVWLATGVELRVPITATVAGAADLVRVAPGPETVVAHADSPRARPRRSPPCRRTTGSYRYRLVLPGEGRERYRFACGQLVRLAAIGDVSPGSALDAVPAHGAAWHWSRVGAWLRGRDVVVANLETAVGTGGKPWPAKNYHFLSPLATIRAMANRAASTSSRSRTTTRSTTAGRPSSAACGRSGAPACSPPVAARR